MSEVFLSNFMRAARTITRAERCLAVDSDFTVYDRYNVSDDVLESTSFNSLVVSAVSDALQQGEAIITNNLISDPAEAPNTNVHLADLRLVVAIPAGKFGAIYLDQHIRQGVFQRDVIEKLSKLATQLIAAEELELTTEQMVERYRAM
jgi:hypothetical protein